MKSLRISGAAVRGLKTAALVLFYDRCHAGAAYTSASSNKHGPYSGSVTDQSGGTIAGASVNVTNVQTGIVRNLAT